LVSFASTMMMDHVNSIVPAMIAVLESALSTLCATVSLGAVLAPPRHSKFEEKGELDSDAVLQASSQKSGYSRSLFPL
jgi:hypothetical protein